MITLTGHGRLTRDVQTRTTHSGKTVATISVASDRRDRDAQPVYLDLIVWQAQATAAAEHLVKGQAVSFSGRFEPREYVTNAGENRVALELHGVDIEYGPKPRGDQPGQPGPRATDEPTQTTSRSDPPRRAGRRASGPPPRADAGAADGSRAVERRSITLLPRRSRVALEPRGRPRRLPYPAHMADVREVEFVFEPQDEGGYHVYAPDLPGLHTQGESLEEATENAREALELYVEGLRKQDVRSGPAWSDASCPYPRDRPAGRLRRSTDRASAGSR